MSLAEELMADFEEDDADELEQAMEVTLVAVAARTVRPFIRIHFQGIKGGDDIEEATEAVAGKGEYNSVYDVAKMSLTDE